jgi:hypothetical protein
MGMVVVEPGKPSQDMVRDPVKEDIYKEDKEIRRGRLECHFR